MSSSDVNIMVLWHAAPIPFEPPTLHPGQWTGYLAEHAPLVEQQQDPRKFLIPRGEFDLAALLTAHGIPKPDWLFVCVDATTPFFARNLSQAAGRRFLCLGDTHHLPSPISRLLPYAAAEPWDGLLFTNNVRHAHWFAQVTQSPQFFEPAIFALELNSPHQATAREELTQPVFYGQMGAFHPRRNRLMTPLLQKNLVHHVAGSSEALTDSMKNASACVNVTLNSDLNSRVFEIAQTGCLQIVDRLAIENGMGSILIPGHNCLAFDDSAELEEIVSDTHQLRKLNPLLGNNLRQEWNMHWGIHVIRERLAESIESDAPRFLTAPVMVRETPVQTVPQLNWRLHVYENLLELHRQHECLEVLIEGEFKDCYAHDLIDLPRIEIVDREKIVMPTPASKFFVKDKENGEPELLVINVSE